LQVEEIIKKEAKQEHLFNALAKRGDPIVWTEDDMQNLEYAVKTISTIENTHHNLGIPTVLMKMADLSNIGAFLVGQRAKGKGTVLAVVERQLLHRNPYVCDFLTKRGLKEIQEMFNNASITVINPDFASLSSEYVRDVSLSLFSNLIYEHRITGNTMDMKLNIQNCRVSFLSSIQPILYKEISETSSYESQSKDRYLRIFMLYFRPTLEDQDKKLPVAPTPPFIKLWQDYDKEQMEQFRKTHLDELPEVPLEVRDTEYYRRVVDCFRMQTSKHRGLEYTRRMLKASALYNGRKNITISDVKFCSLAMPFLYIEKALTWRENASDPLKFSADAYHIFDYITENYSAKPSAIENYFQLRKRKRMVENPSPSGRLHMIKTSLRDDIQLLRANDLITGWSPKSPNAPITENQMYKVNPIYQYWYRLPVLKFLEMIGVKLNV
jgi:hypothetical protein